MEKLVLIFDFDGTIADTHHYLIEVSNHLCEEFQYNKILPHEIDYLKDKTGIEIIKHLRVPILKIPAIIARAKKELYQGISKIRPIPHLQETLIQLKNLPIRIGILSSNSLENIKKFLSEHNLDIFDFIHSTTNVWTKNTSFQKIVKTNNLSLDKILYVGDEARDIVAAKKAGVKIAAVSWGYNSAKALGRLSPDYLINHPKELLSLCQKILY